MISTQDDGDREYAVPAALIRKATVAPVDITSLAVGEAAAAPAPAAPAPAPAAALAASSSASLFSRAISCRSVSLMASVPLATYYR